MSEKDKRVVEMASPSVSGTLLGVFEHALDPKKRLTIPSGWRAAMGDPTFVYVMPDRSGECLNLLPQAEMDVMLAKLRQKALFDPQLNKAAMAIGRASEQIQLDIQGRIRISDKLLQFANLTTTVVMVGSVRMVKLWSPAKLKHSDGVDLEELGTALDLLEG